MVHYNNSALDNTYQFIDFFGNSCSPQMSIVILVWKVVFFRVSAILSIEILGMTKGKDKLTSISTSKLMEKWRGKARGQWSLWTKNQFITSIYYHSPYARVSLFFLKLFGGSRKQSSWTQRMRRTNELLRVDGQPYLFFINS